MSVSVQQILGLLQAVAPPALALDWDNVGLLVDAGTPVDGVLTTLDITPAVVREAVENDCQLIVSHHPVIFHPIKSLHADDVPALLMKNGISAICMHTNLDAAPGGVNDTLCDILGIAAEGRESFAEGCGRIGTTMPTTVEALAKFCADTPEARYLPGRGQRRGRQLLTGGHRPGRGLPCHRRGCAPYRPAGKGKGRRPGRGGPLGHRARRRRRAGRPHCQAVPPADRRPRRGRQRPIFLLIIVEKREERRGRKTGRGKSPAYSFSLASGSPLFSIFSLTL